MKLLTLFFIVLVISTSIAYGSSQQQNVTGTVTDATTGEPFSGVHVLIEGTQTGTLTDLNGKFSLPKPENGAILVFSFVGYISERITWSGQVMIDVKLVQDIKALDDVVVIGYGTIKKSDLTGAVGSANIKVIEKTTPVNVEAALQGHVAGLVSTSNSGDPAGEGSITIRGVGTVNNNRPIYVVDGMLIESNPNSTDASNINFLNPFDIASIDVLKDASAQAIYGSRGANGVILITTKKGSAGIPVVTFNTTFTYESSARTARLMNADEYKDYILTSNYNGYMRQHPNANPDLLPDTLNNATKVMIEQYNKGINTDWMKEIQRKDKWSQNYDLSISGGTKDFHYSGSIGYLNKKGLMLYSDYKRYSFRLNTDYKASKFVTIGENLGITSSSQTSDWNWINTVRLAMWSDPISPVLQPAGTVDPSDPNYEYNKYSPLYLGGMNPVMQAEILKNLHRLYLTVVGNVFLEVTILKDFKFRSSFGTNQASMDFTYFNPAFDITSSPNNLSQINKVLNESNGWLWENTFSWTKKLKDHSFNAFIGYTSEYTKISNLTASKKNTPGNSPEMQTFDAANDQPIVNGGYNVLTMNSYMGRINYSFLDKYLLTASMRRDGSSKFAEGNRWGTFPSFSLGWKIVDEGFFRNLGASFISNLKLRAGWGQIGNSSIPVYYGYVSQVSSNMGLTGGVDNRYIFNENVYQGYSLSTIGTPGLTWETTEQTNFGLELAFFKNTLSLSADYYIKNTRNMLLQVPFPNYAGYPWGAAPYTNAGSVQNKGIEMVINWHGTRGKFTYGAEINGSVFKNVVTSLGNGNKPILSNGGWFPSRTEVGSSIGRFRGYVVDGVFQTEEEVQNYKGPEGTILQPDANAGDFRFKNLNNDDAIDEKDETLIGDPWPKLIYGININLGYSNFDFLVFVQGSYGNDIYDYGRQYGNTLGVMAPEYFYKNAWRGPGTTNSFPILSTFQENENYRNSNYYVEDGSYMRLKNIQFGYNLPKEICEKIKVSNARIWIGGTNLLTLTKYHGNDPEIGASQSPTLDAGIDQAGYYPKPIEMSLGINISF